MLVFYWNDDRGREKWTDITGRFYVGRPTKDLVPPSVRFNPGTVYMFWIDGEERVIDTGYSSFFVSRKHLLVDAVNGSAQVMDHGSHGRGSSNGTYINGRRIPSGRWVKINAGDTIRLGGTGDEDIGGSPGFLLVVGLMGEDGKPILSLGSGVRYLPESIASAAAGKGVRVIEKARENDEEKPIVKAHVPDKPIHVETGQAQIFFDKYMFTIFYLVPQLYNTLLQAYRDKTTINQIHIHIKPIIENEVFHTAIKQKCSKYTYNKLQEIKKALNIEANNILIETLHEFLTAITKELGIKTILQNHQ